MSDIDFSNYVVKTLLTCPVDGCCGCLNLRLYPSGTGTAYCNECAIAVAAAYIDPVDNSTARDIDLKIQGSNF